MKIVFEDGVCEDVDAEPAGGNDYRLLMTPLCTSVDARLGDVVELTGEGEIWRFRRIVTRSPFVTLDYLVPRDIAESPELASLLARVREAGGEWERAFGGVVLIHVPASEVSNIGSWMTQLAGEPGG